MKKWIKRLLKTIIILGFIGLVIYATFAAVWAKEELKFRYEQKAITQNYLKKCTDMSLNLAHPFLREAQYNEHFKNINGKFNERNSLLFLRQVEREVVNRYRFKFEKKVGTQISYEKAYEMAKNTTPVLLIKKMRELCYDLSNLSKKTPKSWAELEKMNKKSVEIQNKLEKVLKESKEKLPD